MNSELRKMRKHISQRTKLLVQFMNHFIHSPVN